MPLLNDDQYNQGYQAGMQMLQGGATMANPLNSLLAPYMSGRPAQTVLSDDATQNSLKQVADKQIQSLLRGPTKADRWGDAAGRVFSDVIAPAIGGFTGGPATAYGALESAKQMRDNLQTSQKQRQLEQQQARDMLKTTVDIVNSTSPYGQKQMGQAFKAIAQQENAGIKRDQLAERKDWHTKQATRYQNQLNETMRHNKQTETLQKQGIDLRADLGKQRLAIDRATLQLQAERFKQIERLSKDRTNQEARLKLLEIDAKLKMYNTTNARLVEMQNAELAQKAAAVDPKTGMFKFMGADGKPYEVAPLDASQYQVPDTIDEWLKQAAPELSAGDDLAAADKIVQSLQPQAQVAAPAQQQAASVIPPSAIAVYKQKVTQDPANAETYKMQLMQAGLKRGIPLQQLMAAVGAL